MRYGIWLAVGFLFAPATAWAQFAADRGTPPAAAPTAPAAVAPAPPSDAPHPWAIRPEHGAWFICVKSYTGPDARKSAEELTADIRQNFKAACYMYEWGADERAKEEQRRAFVRTKLEEQHAPFIQVQNELKKRAESQGLPFDPTPVKVRVPTLSYPTQWGVLVGGFKDMETARKALDTVRLWPPPKSKHLLDTAVMARPTDKGAEKEAVYINPFATALVVPNPSIRRADADKPPPIDPALLKLNEQEELSALKIRKPWTLMVKGFTLQTKLVTKDADRGVMDRLFGGSGPDAADQLDATAKQARELARALRDANFKPHSFESYVLHIRNGSIVTVGQFDGPDDPALVEAQRTLQWMTFEVRDRKDGPVKEVRKLFDNVYPMQVPRAQ